MAVVHLVRVDHDNLPGPARPRLAAVMKTLEPRFRDTHRIGLVPVPIIGVTAKAGAQPLQPSGRSIDDQEVVRSSHCLNAQTFKTISAVALGCAA